MLLGAHAALVIQGQYETNNDGSLETLLVPNHLWSETEPPVSPGSGGHVRRGPRAAPGQLSRIRARLPRSPSEESQVCTSEPRCCLFSLSSTPERRSGSKYGKSSKTRDVVCGTLRCSI